MPSYKTKVQPTRQKALRQQLDAAGQTYRWQLKPEQYCTYRLDGHATHGWIRIKQYGNGTFYIDAENATDLQVLLNTLGLSSDTPTPGHSDTNPSGTAYLGQSTATTQVAFPYAGSDESGKGDYFGPLVVAAVMVTEQSANELKTLGIADSKTLTDAKITSIIEPMLAVIGQGNSYISCLMPESYNPHYQQADANLNTLLSKTHAHTLKQLAERSQPKPTCWVVDNFGGERKIRHHIEPLGLPLHLYTQAESRYIAVAAASCLARYTFISRMHQLSEQWGLKLPLGAGPGVKRVKQVFIHQHGQSALHKVAKVHFKV
jgi:ribonuclease HIII